MANTSTSVWVPRRTDLARQALWVVLLVALIYWIGDADFDVYVALQAHEPSWRIFRALLLGTLLGTGAAGSLYVWSRTPRLGLSTVATLLFQPATPDDEAYEIALTFDPARRTAGISRSSEPRQEDADWFVEPHDPISELVDHRPVDHVSTTEEEGPLRPDPKDLEEEEEEPFLEEQQDPNLMPVPAPAAIMSAVLHWLSLILLALFFYTMSASGYALSSDSPSYAPWLRRAVARVASPTFALVLFSYALYRAFRPWRPGRRAFWIIGSYTVLAPWKPVTFRDGFVGDIMTSSVRPAQDVAFTLFYLVCGLRGWWSQAYQAIPTNHHRHDQHHSYTAWWHQAEAQVVLPALEKSWWLHTLWLPMCMISPLWWRFLQTLRQCYDHRQRWPYLGNAFKYFMAAQVAMWGIFQPHLKQSMVWLSCFVLATLYQIWWDIFMDWGLLERTSPRSAAAAAAGGAFWTGWGLRRQRLYSSRAMYWTIFVVNILLRFCWTLNFIPPRYLDSTGLLKNNFWGDLSLLGPTIAAAEIIRRTLWGLIRLEWEAIKVLGSGHDDASSSKETSGKTLKTKTSWEMGMGDAGMEETGLEMTPMKVRSGEQDALPMQGSRIITLGSDMSGMSDIQVLAELTFYATTFAGIGLLLAAHRETL